MTPRQLLGLYLDRHRTDPCGAKWRAAIVAMFDEREADVVRLAKSLRDCVEDTDETIQCHILSYGENYKPHRLKAIRDQAAEARAALAAIDARAKETT